MKESPSRLEVYVVMSLLAILLLFAQNAYYLASERLTIRIEAAVGSMSTKQHQEQSVINHLPATEAELRHLRIQEQLNGLRGTSADDPRHDPAVSGQAGGGGSRD